MPAVLDHTILPPSESESTEIQAVDEFLAHEELASLTGPDGSTLDLPREVYTVLRDVVRAMATGQAITVAPHNTLLTTQEAADLLGVSRPTFVKLLEDGRIPFQRPSRHRRVELADLIQFQQRTRAQRRQVLDEMSSEAADGDAYDDINEFVQTR